MIKLYQWKIGLKFLYLRWMNIPRVLSYMIGNNISNNTTNDKRPKQKQLIIPKRMKAYIVVIGCWVFFNPERR